MKKNPIVYKDSELIFHVFVIPLFKSSILLDVLPNLWNQVLILFIFGSLIFVLVFPFYSQPEKDAKGS